MTTPQTNKELVEAAKEYPRTKSMTPHPFDGMCIHVDVGDGARMDIIDPRSFEDGGPEWTMRYGNVEGIRYGVAMLLNSYDYLLSGNISTAESIRRLRLMRKARATALQSNPANIQEGGKP